MRNKALLRTSLETDSDNDHAALYWNDRRVSTYSALLKTARNLSTDL